ncbi:MAG: hypothetical protein HYS09_03110 [Chloroflexi bacterium]|nr:hypothetical protein [Chloroflexota bacterium]
MSKLVGRRVSGEDRWQWFQRQDKQSREPAGRKGRAMQLIVRKRGYRIIPALAILAALVLASVVVFAVPLPAGTANAPNFEFDPNEAGKNGVLEDDAGTDGVLDWDGDDSVNAAGVIDACRVIDDDADASTPPTCDGAADSFTNADIGECRQANAPAVAGTSDGAVPGSGTAGAGLLVCDGSAGNFTDRDHFTGGSKNEGTEWDIVGGSNPKKGDFAELMLYAKFGDSPFDVDTATDDLFIFTGSSRLDVNGSTHLDAELNQRDVKRDCTNDGLDPSVGAVDYAACETARTVGDILIAIDLESGGNPQLRVFKFCGPSGAGSEIPDCDPSTVGTDATTRPVAGSVMTCRPRGSWRRSWTWRRSAST